MNNFYFLFSRALTPMMVINYRVNKYNIIHKLCGGNATEFGYSANDTTNSQRIIPISMN